jgi:hypothetical protein
MATKIYEERLKNLHPRDEVDEITMKVVKDIMKQLWMIIKPFASLDPCFDSS